MTTSEARYKETDSEENLGLISNNGTHDVHQKSRSWSKFILSFTTIGFGLLSLILAVKLHYMSPELTFKDGYLTDWGPAKAAIEIQQVTYTSAFRYNETSQRYYREFDPNLPQYVGVPSPKIDDAWEELLKGQYVVLNETEAMNLDNPVPIEGMYLAEVEVMHSLHCLNAIRKEINRDYYDKNDRHPLPKEIRQTHVGMLYGNT
ncbi:hypothetical protein B0O99DRAFT_337811 [Bisporella sp. PMI_857]|nr:hypothetical protein B0O99DRAFT_337811 [Bisporella sp. PMI_857]